MVAIVDLLFGPQLFREYISLWGFADYAACFQGVDWNMFVVEVCGLCVSSRMEVRMEEIKIKKGSSVVASRHFVVL